VKTQSQYTIFEGDFNQVGVELIKASQEGRRPILMNSESYETLPLKQRVTRYTIVFEQTVLQGA
jgi:hypothetical protein